MTAARKAIAQPIRSVDEEIYGVSTISVTIDDVIVGSIYGPISSDVASLKGLINISIPENPTRIPMMSHFLTGSPRMTKLKNGAIKVFVKNILKAFENVVSSKAANRSTSDSTPVVHLRSKST